MYRYFYAISSDVDAMNPGTVTKYFSLAQCKIQRTHLCFSFQANQSRYVHQNKTSMERAQLLSQRAHFRAITASYSKPSFAHAHKSPQAHLYNNAFLQSEDEGVILSTMIWGNGDVNRVGLLVLCGRTFKELGRCEFETPGPVPKCLHGWYNQRQWDNASNSL